MEGGVEGVDEVLVVIVVGFGEAVLGGIDQAVDGACWCWLVWCKKVRGKVQCSRGSYALHAKYRSTLQHTLYYKKKKKKKSTRRFRI